jgi:hypothetical protein
VKWYPPPVAPDESLRDLHAKFRDEQQRRLARDIVVLRLADDRDQDECRYLMRFAWQLLMSYREVTEPELEQHLTEAKLQAIKELIQAIRRSPEDIDLWITTALGTWPVVQDRGYQACPTES